MTGTESLASQATPDLLRLYAAIIDELKARGIQRSTNNPVADYTEWLVTQALGLALAENSRAGYDAVDADGLRYQIKGRRLSGHRASRQLSAIRGMADPEVDPFDVLVGVIFASDFTIARAAAIPIKVVRELAKWQSHVNGHRFMLADAVWFDPRVTDVTEPLRKAAG